LFPPAGSGWIPKVMICSSRSGSGIDEVWDTVLEYMALTHHNGYFEKRRMEQSKYWMYETINQSLKESFYHDSRIQKLLEQFEKKVLSGETTPFSPAKVLLEKYFRRRWIKLNRGRG
jgi:LAO/AO transport system kinase